MIRSWISFLLPDDEYKRTRLLYFYAEGAVILFLALIAVIVGYHYWQVDITLGLVAAVIIFPLYITVRYILSGMEYTDVATEKSYKKELKVIFVRVLGFVIIFSLLFMIFELPNGFHEWGKLFGLLVSVCVVWFFTSFISLKRSYEKNRDLSS